MIACPNCGGSIEGDGFTSVLHCEYAVDDDYWSVEPDGLEVL